MTYFAVSEFIPFFFTCIMINSPQNNPNVTCAPCVPSVVKSMAVNALVCNPAPMCT